MTVRRVALLVLLVTMPLAGQEARARLVGRVPNAALPALDSIVGEACEEGIPTEPLIQKALEGGAKGVPSADIVAAVGASAAQLRSALALLRVASESRPESAEVTAVAVALARGVSPALVSNLTAALPGEPNGPALHAVADLVGHGVAEDAAVDLIVDAAGAGLRGLRLLDVAAAVVLELQRGQTQTVALARVRDLLPNIPPPPRPAPNTVSRARRLSAPPPTERP